MFDFTNFYSFTGHSYTLAATGISFKSLVFKTRRAAQKYMYDYCGYHNLAIQEVYDDKHYKTYVCDNGIKFYINRSN